MGTFTKVADAAALPPGKAMAVTAGGRELALFNVGGRLFAIDGECTHAGAPLCEGDVEGTVLTCPWHGATFDLESGKNLSRPAPAGVHCYPVRVEGGEVQVELP